MTSLKHKRPDTRLKYKLADLLTRQLLYDGLTSEFRLRFSFSTFLITTDLIHTHTRTHTHTHTRTHTRIHLHAHIHARTRFYGWCKTIRNSFYDLINRIFIHISKPKFDVDSLPKLPHNTLIFYHLVGDVVEKISNFDPLFVVILKFWAVIALDRNWTGSQGNTHNLNQWFPKPAPARIRLDLWARKGSIIKS